MANGEAKAGGGRGIPWRLVGWGTAALLLLLPLVAMQFTDEVNWDGFDFAFAAVLMGSVGLVLELTLKKSRDAGYRMGVGVALAAAFLLVWLTGAVGVIGSEREVANLLYAGVLAAALAGAVLARFRAAGMARAMAATALAQALVPVLALALGWTAAELIWSAKVWALTGGFAALWLASAWLFHSAAASKGLAS